MQSAIFALYVAVGLLGAAALGALPSSKEPAMVPVLEKIMPSGIEIRFEPDFVARTDTNGDLSFTL